MTFEGSKPHSNARMVSEPFVGATGVPDGVDALPPQEAATNRSCVRSARARA
jgi:hypothetical protein